MRGLITIIRVLFGTAVATVFGCAVGLVVALGPDEVFGLKHHDSGSPPVVAFWLVFLALGFVALWIGFTPIVEAQRAVKLAPAILIAAGIFSVYGIIILAVSTYKSADMALRDFLAFMSAGAACGFMYWFVALITKPKPRQT